MRAIVRLSVCMSIDGRIAASAALAPNQEKFGGWTSAEDKKYFRNEIDRCDAVFVGRKTLLQMPSIDKPIIVITNKFLCDIWAMAKNHDATETLMPDSHVIMKWLEKNPGKKILLCGGIKTYHLFLRAGLVDYIIMTIEPKVLNAGPALCFDTKEPAALKAFNLKSAETLNAAGTLRLTWKRDGFDETL